MEPSGLTFRDLKHATENFSPLYMIGQGKYGKVYEGRLISGEAIAVKLLRIEDLGLDDAGFEKEFRNLSKLRHRNLVGHIKYIYQTGRAQKELSTRHTFRALCYDYITNGSLESHLSDKSRLIDWPTRLKIIKGIYFNLPMMVQEYLGERPGERVYWPPEWVASKAFDVFSLGAVMIEILSGQCYSTAISHEQLIDRVCKSWRKKMQKSSSCSNLEACCHQVKRSIEIALRCVDKDPHKRPSVGDIVHVLNPATPARRLADGRSVPDAPAPDCAPLDPSLTSLVPDAISSPLPPTLAGLRIEPPLHALCRLRGIPMRLASLTPPPSSLAHASASTTASMPPPSAPDAACCRLLPSFPCCMLSEVHQEFIF
ncbi:hypothetical protein QOZ80_5AG0390880 [Eleusine coracana subsp. coracana]|nr:hypothetical protein QOZ80_5AG0390880 [Eleusine coracana subsp. coracana]